MFYCYYYHCFIVEAAPFRTLEGRGEGKIWREGGKVRGEKEGGGGENG